MAAQRTARERARAEFTADLLAAARARLVADGAAQLSLRAVARDLGVASSAVYRYVPSRDALLTALIVESYDAVGQAAEVAAARARADGADPAQTWLEVARAVRVWARDNRSAYELVYGTPVPGYRAPQDTIAPALRIWGVIVDLVLAAADAGTLVEAGPDFDPAGRVTAGVYALAQQRREGLPPADPRPAAATDPAEPSEEFAQVAVRTITLFSSLLGAISAELFGHLHGISEDYPALFDVTIATAARGVGLHVDLGRG
ncbi:TetR/AcrR family transcriptional regulator [Actinotalea subterranea]|uniref:TetR/AcrR family transcriptional regulator n=1 Tax=Actinotalea subterranea TaxID=2607497 RepID=UPI0011ED1F23|nr:TetR/AcrR family transcriptional regulator [Actinotalea subterranea]